MPLRTLLVGALHIFVRKSAVIFGFRTGLCLARACPPRLWNDRPRFCFHDCGKIALGVAFTIVDRSSTVLPSRLWNDRPRLCFHDCGTMSCTRESAYKKSAAWRTKYFLGRRTLPPGRIGFDGSNRGGNPPNGERCWNLLKSMVTRYDTQEGDHQSVCVEETPGTNEVQKFNDQALDGDPLLTSSIEGSKAEHGSLAHSHLNQVLEHFGGRWLWTCPG